MTTKCRMCGIGIEKTDPIEIGDLDGFRPGEVACDWECHDDAVLEAHDGCCVESETGPCQTCWRAMTRQAHAAIARHKGPRPEMRLLGELFAEEKGDL